MKAVTPKEARLNLELAQRVISSEPADISAQVGILALEQLADLLPGPDFEQFINAAVQHATTGVPQQADQEQDQQQPQEQAAPSPGAPQNGGTSGAPSSTT